MTTALDTALLTAIRAWVNDAVAQAMTTPPQPKPTMLTRGCWVWDYPTGIGDLAWETDTLAACKATGFTDLYCYTFAATVADSSVAPKMAAFNTKAAAMGIRVWGLEGDRAYFSDGQGPAQLYNTIIALDVFNAAFPGNSKFYGLMIDMEPHDLPSGFVKFHNGIPSTALSVVQATDRQTILEDWCTIHSNCQQKLHAVNMKFASCLPSWCYDYFGAPVSCSFNGVMQNVWLHVAPLVDLGAILSYSTTTAGIIAKTMAAMLASVPNSHTSFSVETTTGVGSGVSYGDTQGKQSRARVLADLSTIEQQYALKPNYAGWNIHSMAGWKALPA